MERIWGGRRLETLFGKVLPTGARIGESWEIVDRAEAQSVVRDGPWRGKTLHDLWQLHRREIFGDIADSPRFPLLIKLLDAQEKLSLQVHPPAAVAAELGGEPKTEFWFIADAQPGAELFVGLTKGISRRQFEAALANGTAEECVHRIPVRADDGMFLPSGRMHAIGAGNVIIEIQQNSDTTYRLFRLEPHDRGRHTASAPHRGIAALDRFRRLRPALTTSAGESLVRENFSRSINGRSSNREKSPLPGSFAIVICLVANCNAPESRSRPENVSSSRPSFGIANCAQPRRRPHFSE